MEGTLPLTQSSTVPPSGIVVRPPQKRQEQKNNSPSHFDVFVADKGPIILGGTAGAITGFFTATPLAKYFIKRGFDESFNAVARRADDLKAIFFEDLSSKEFSKIIKRLQKDHIMAQEVAEIVAAKLPESLKIIGFDENQTKVIMEKHVNPIVKYIKDVKFKDLKENEIEKLRVSMASESKNIFLFLSKFFGIKGKDNEETIALTRKRVLGDLNKFGKKSQVVMNPIKNELIEKYVKATTKYKITAAILGGLSLAGIVGIFKPTPKFHQD